MALLRPEDLQFLTQSFAELQRDVTLTLRLRQPSRLIVPGRDTDPAEHSSQELEQLIGEVASASTRVKVVQQAAEEGERAPSIQFSTETSQGRLRYYGLPSGYEMSTLVGTILDLGVHELGVPEEVRTRLDALAADAHVQVFVTPS